MPLHTVQRSRVARPPHTPLQSCRGAALGDTDGTGVFGLAVPVLGRDDGGGVLRGEGAALGDAVGLAVCPVPAAAFVGLALGTAVGWCELSAFVEIVVGATVGLAVGPPGPVGAADVGAAVGLAVGAAVGLRVAPRFVGARVGAAVGAVGLAVGLAVGAAEVGAAVGLAVGAAVGVDVGALVTFSSLVLVQIKSASCPQPVPAVHRLETSARVQSRADMDLHKVSACGHVSACWHPPNPLESDSV